MRIAYVLTSLGMGGAERLTLQLAEAMAARGHAVCLLVLRPPAARQWPTGLEVVHLDMGKTLPSLLRGLLRARRQLRLFRPQILHAHTSFANLFARLLRLLYPAAVLSTVHNVYEGGWPRTLAYRLTDPLSRLTVLVCQAAADRYIRIGAVPRSKCRVLSNAIDLRQFQPDPARRAALRSQQAIGGDFLWLSAGRISPAKDFPTLLRAFALLRQRRPEARLAIAGGRAVNLALAGRADLDPQLERDGVCWLGARNDMAALLDAADAFVLSSAWEGIPLALAEAMAMEKPVVATSVGGVPELLGPEGSQAPPRNPERLAQAMRAVMDAPPEDRAAQGRRARQRIAEDFALDPWIANWESIYRQIARRP